MERFDKYLINEKEDLEDDGHNYYEIGNVIISVFLDFGGYSLGVLEKIKPNMDTLKALKTTQLDLVKEYEYLLETDFINIMNKLIVEYNTKVCVLCGQAYTEKGNSAEPIKLGKCCDHCNEVSVIPARLEDLTYYNL